jgi:hypothetical protein
MESTVITADRVDSAEATARHGPVAAGLTHEFNPSENTIICELASRMHLVGLFTLGVGLFVIMVGTILLNVPSILSGTLYSVIGLWTDRASESFKKIADTQGKDASHLMRALRDLKNLYTLQVWICTFIMASAVFGMATLLLQKWG